ncbi:MAG: ParA family protein [Fimbriimonadaceae bacterium]|nr:ParA family protein [Fimbriimonadaceae bacterium]
MDLVFMADKGGVGKSTLAFHVATRLRQLGLDVGLYDLDSRGTSSTWAGESGYLQAYDLRRLQCGAPAHQMVVWDTAPHPDAEMRAELARAADLVVIVANGDRDSMAAAGDLYRAMQAAGASDLAVVFNGLHPVGREGEACVAAAREEGLPALDAYVRRYSCYVQARWDGVSVVDRGYSRADNAWADICAVTDELLARAAARLQAAD